MPTLESPAELRALLPPRPFASNCYLNAAELERLCGERLLAVHPFEGGLLLTREDADAVRGYGWLFALGARPALPATAKPLLMEFVFSDEAKAPAELGPWLDAGLRLRCARVMMRRSGPPARPLPPPAGTRLVIADQALAIRARALLTAQLDSASALIPDPLDAACVLCALDDSGALTGALHADRAGASRALRHIAVAPAARRRGIARALLSHWLADGSAKRQQLWVRADNQPARALYASFGFENTDRMCYTLLADR